MPTIALWPTRREFLAKAAAAGVLTLLAGALRAIAKASICPFRISVPGEALVDLRKRIAATRWPDRETVGDHIRGVQLAKTPAALRISGRSI